MRTIRKSHLRYTIVLVAAGAVAAVLGAASLLGARDDSAPTTPRQSAPAGASATALFRGIEQSGPALGSPNAPVTLVEYADIQCPYCAQWARQALPTLVDDYVRTGKLRVVFHGLAFLGPDSDEALRAAIVAGEDGRLWDVVHALYERQGAENAGWVTDELIGDIAGGIGLDKAKLLEERWGDAVDRELKRAAEAARAAGVSGTPAFEVGPTGGPLQLVQVSSLGPEGIVPAIEAVLAA